MRPTRDVILALGGNLAGKWGYPEQTLAYATRSLRTAGICVKFASDIYRSTAIGGGRQPPYLNAVIVVQSNLAPAQLLRLIKSWERAAGRRLGRRWGPRSLDIDIVAQAGLSKKQRSPRRPAGQIVLPHPHMHERAFVLAPLCQVAPHWHHPLLNRTARQLLAQAAVQKQLHGIKRLSGTARLLLGDPEQHKCRN